VKWFKHRRPEVLYVEDGETQSNLDLPIALPQMPSSPPLDALIPLLNKRWSELQNENLLNRAIANSSQ
jgi:hypothetical protein